MQKIFTMNIQTIIGVISKAQQDKEDKWFVFHYGPTNQRQTSHVSEISFYNDEVVFDGKDGDSLYVSADEIHTMYESKSIPKGSLFSYEPINENKTYKTTEEQIIK